MSVPDQESRPSPQASVVQEVTFYDVTAKPTRFFAPVGEVGPEPVWLVIREEPDGPYRLWFCEAKAALVPVLNSVLKDPDPEAAFMVDRSFLRQLGTKTPSHPASHQSFSIWKRLSPGEAAELAQVQLPSVRGIARITNDSY